MQRTKAQDKQEWVSASSHGTEVRVGAFDADMRQPTVHLISRIVH